METTKQLTLTLSVEEVVLVLEALGNHPYNKVATTLLKIKQSAEEQLKATEPVEEKPL